MKGPESPEPKVSSFRMDVIPSPVPAEEKGATNPRDHYALLVVPLAGKILITFHRLDLSPILDLDHAVPKG